MRDRHRLLLLYTFLFLFPAALLGQNSIRTESPSKTAAPGEGLIDYVHNPPQDLPDFEPAGDQAGMGDVLAAAGNNVAKLFANLLNISAVETVHLEKLDSEGEPESVRDFEYLYLCMGTVDKKDPSFDEYRSDTKGHEISQLGLDKGFMLTSGFVSAPLILHPAHQNGSSFRLLGYQKRNGRDTIVMAYAQIPARSRIFGSFRNGRRIGKTFKQGMVWIDRKNYQILRLVSDLLTPLPQVKLEKLQTQIDFDEIQLDPKTPAFWLPVKVIVTVHWNGKALRNTHLYSDFRLFNVESSQKIAKPFEAAKSAGEKKDTYTSEKGSRNSSGGSVSPTK
jgi:hypothetical protein